MTAEDLAGVGFPSVFRSFNSIEMKTSHGCIQIVPSGLDFSLLRVHNVLMKRVISLRRLKEFWIINPDAETPLREWYKVARKADWKNLQDVRKTYPNADAVAADSGATMTVFNIGGNKYRLITSIWYGGRQVYIKQVLTHAEYSKDRWKKKH